VEVVICEIMILSLLNGKLLVSIKFILLKKIFENPLPVLFILGGVSLMVGFALIWPQVTDVWSGKEFTDLTHFEVRKPNVKYGINLDEFHLEENEVQQNEFFSKILHKCYDDGRQVQTMLDNTSNVFDSRKLRAGKPYLILKSKDCQTPAFLVYEESSYSYIKYDIGGYCAERMFKPVERKLEVIEGHIAQGSSLYKSMIDAGVNAYQGLTSRMERALAWTVDFHHLQAEDHYKVYYERIYVDGVEMDAGEVKAAYFRHRGRDIYVFRYENGKYDGYYDEKGNSAKRAFLKAPVEFSRISSRYNLKRYHPVLKRVKAHLGTDYAAPTGTPIVSVADGVIEAAAYTSGNGNYVKVRHDKVYQTQYLHMSKFAAGIKPGRSVKQGEVIGYVGSTGLATGPHVCYRFWKNGVQVDPLREVLPVTEPMSESELPNFFIHRDSLMERLNINKVPATVDERKEHIDVGQSVSMVP